MPDTENTCKAKATITIGRHTEADVECGLEENHDERNHVTSQPTEAKDAATGKVGPATLIFTWR